MILRKAKTAFRLLWASITRRLDLWRARNTIPHYFDINGFLSVREALALHRYAGMLPTGAQIIEIGAWQGKSTYCLASGLRTGRLLVIDPFDGSGGGDRESEELYRSLSNGGDRSLLDTFNLNMEKAEVASKIDVLRGYSNEYAGTIQSMDLLFIDADHSVEGCTSDFENFAFDVRPGGYLLLHDYSPDRPEFGPTWVVTNKVIPSEQFETIEVIHSLWVGRRV